MHGCKLFVTTPPAPSQRSTYASTKGCAKVSASKAMSLGAEYSRNRSSRSTFRLLASCRIMFGRCSCVLWKPVVANKRHNTPQSAKEPCNRSCLLAALTCSMQQAAQVAVCVELARKLEAVSQCLQHHAHMLLL